MKIVNPKRLIIIGASLVVALGSGLGVYFGTQGNNSNSNSESSPSDSTIIESSTPDDTSTESSTPEETSPSESSPSEHVHSYSESITTDPTCTTLGEKTYECECGDSYTEEVAMIAHNLKLVEELLPSCETKGHAAHYSCEACSKLFLEETATTEVTLQDVEVAALGHTEETDEAVPATCETTGLTEGSHCSVCEKVLVAQEEVPALGHTEDIDAAKEATCTELGLTEGKHCSVCEKILVAQEVIELLPHTEVEDASVEPTCTETGLTLGKHCSVCNTITVPQETIEALGHIEVIDLAVEATCETTGLTEGKHCSVCEEVFISQDVVAALGHTEVVDVALAPTCENTGLTEGSHCSVCSKVLVAQEEVAALGHTPVVDVALAPTCETTGLTEGSHCTVCEKVLVKQEVVETLGHTEVKDAAVAATCETTGLTEGSHCSVCEKVLVAQEVVDALGHKSEVDAAVPATCETTGLTEGSHCSVCEKVLVAQNVIPALTHKYGEWTEVTKPTLTTTGLLEKVCGNDASHKQTKELPSLNNEDYAYKLVSSSTCTVAGSEQYTITVDGQSFTYTVTLELKEHNYESIVTDPTCEDKGYTTHTCSACGDSYKDNEVVASGHDYDESTWKKDASGHWHECKVCNAKDEVIPHVPGEEATEENAQVCTVCNHVIVPALNHVHVRVLVEAVEATCTTAGNVAYYVCGGEYACGKFFEDAEGNVEIVDHESVIIAALGHTEVKDAAKAADCENTGLTEGSHCSVCSKVLVAQNVVPALGHTPVVDSAKAATCLETGLTEGSHCSVCSKVLVAQEEVAALGHDEVDHEGKAATCENSGWEAYVTCSRCSYTTYKEIAALGHTEVIDEAVPAKCTTTGLTEGKHCSVCEKVTVAQNVVPSLGHDKVTHDAKAATCENNGWNAYETCSRCDYTTYKEIAALGHTEVKDAAKDATCLETGLTEGKHCSVCSKVLVAQNVVPALGHDEVDHEGKAATCTEAGWKAYVTCSRCDYTTYESIEALNHNIINHDAKAPTCTETGWDAYETCSRCDYTSYKEKAALEHDEVDHEGKAATCTEAGWKAYVTCSRCDYTTYESIEALDHNIINHEAKAPTCEEIGWDAYETCSRCDYTTYKEKSALGHDEVDHEGKAATCTEAGWKAYVTCSRCDYTTYEAIDALDHNYGQWTVTTNPTVDSTGLLTKVCSRDNEHTTTFTLPKLDKVNYTFNEVPSTCAQEGTQTYTYSKDGQTFNFVIDLELADHNYGNLIAEEPATCKSAGTLAHYYCEDCGTYFTSEKVETTSFELRIPKLSHTEVIDAEVPATCTETGLTQGSHCSVCGETIVAQEVVAATGHVAPGYLLKVIVAEEEKYIEVSNGKAVYVTTPTMFWQYDSEHNVFVITVGNNQYFLGTYKTYPTMAASNISFINNNNNYLAHLYSDETTVVEEFELNTEYSLALVHGGDEDKIYYLTGLMSGDYLGASTSYAEAATLIVELAEIEYNQIPYIIDADSHYKLCAVCDEKVFYNIHNGGEATCQEQALCDDCNAPYGDLVDHNFDEEWSFDNFAHYKQCLNPNCNETSEYAGHSFNNGETICNVCFAEVEPAEYSYYFSKSDFNTETTETTLNGIKWDVKYTWKTETKYVDTSNDNGLQFGKSDNPVTSIVLTTQSEIMINDVIVYATPGSGILDSTIQVFVGDEAISEAKIITYSTPNMYYSFVSNETKYGKIKIVITQPTSTKAVYLSHMLFNVGNPTIIEGKSIAEAVELTSNLVKDTTSYDKYELSGTINIVEEKCYLVDNEISIELKGALNSLHQDFGATVVGELFNDDGTPIFINCEVISSIPTKHQVTIQPSENGTTTPIGSLSEIEYGNSLQLDIVPENNYRFSHVTVDGKIYVSQYDEEHNIVSVVITSNCVIQVIFEEDVEIVTKEISETYTFANIPEGTKYATESHVLSDYLTINITKCHLTTELRIYSSSTNNGVVIGQAAGVIKSLSFNAGNKADTLNVYGSLDGGETWVLIKEVSVTSSYKDYTVDFGDTAYTMFKLDVAGGNQVRLKTLGIIMEVEE